LLGVHDVDAILPLSATSFDPLKTLMM